LDARVQAGGVELVQLAARVTALSPAATLERGYAVVQRADGAVVRGPDEVAVGDPLRVRLARGELAARVEGDAPAENDGPEGGAVGTSGRAGGAGRAGRTSRSGR